MIIGHCIVFGIYRMVFNILMSGIFAIFASQFLIFLCSNILSDREVCFLILKLDKNQNLVEKIADFIPKNRKISIFC